MSGGFTEAEFGEVAEFRARLEAYGRRHPDATHMPLSPRERALIEVMAAVLDEEVRANPEVARKVARELGRMGLP